MSPTASEPITKHRATTRRSIDLVGLHEPQAAARAAVRGLLTDRIHRPVGADVELVVDELVGNAVQHGGGAVAFTCDVSPRSIVVTVIDRGAGPTRLAACPPSTADPYDAPESGRGLLIVDALATGWSVEPGKDFKAVIAVFEVIKAP